MKSFYVPFEHDTNLHDQIYMCMEGKGRDGCNGMDSMQEAVGLYKNLTRPQQSV